MTTVHLKTKMREWLRRYIPAETLGTLGAVIAASLAYNQSHSYIAAAVAGWAVEGVVFYGYFVIAELLRSHSVHRHLPVAKRIMTAIIMASTNLLVEFAPAEIIDTLIIRPFAMYLLPQFIHPYPLGFFIGKLCADALFYILAIAGYEARKRWVRR